MTRVSALFSQDRIIAVEIFRGPDQTASLSVAIDLPCFVVLKEPVVGLRVEITAILS